MLTTLGTVVVAGAALILTPLCSIVILPLPKDPARHSIDRELNGEAAAEKSGLR